MDTIIKLSYYRRNSFTTVLALAIAFAVCPLVLAQDDIDTSPQAPRMTVVKRGVADLSRQLNASVRLMEPTPNQSASASELDLSTFSHLISARGSDDSGVQRMVGQSHILTLARSEAYVESRSSVEAARWFAISALWTDVADASSQISQTWLNHDSLHDRWAITAAAHSAASGPAVLLAVSQTGDPAGKWRVYRLEAAGRHALRPGTTAVLFGEDTLTLNTSWVARGNSVSLHKTESDGVREVTGTYVISEGMTATSDAGFSAGVSVLLVPPQPSGLTPRVGTGNAQQFIASYTPGSAAITTASLLFNSTLYGPNGCWVYYNGNPSQLGLYADNGATISYITVGLSNTVQNSQCVLNGLGSFVSSSAGSLFFYANLTFKPAFAGTKAAYMNVTDANGSSSDWQVRGNWTVPTGNLSPRPVGVAPNSGTGTSQQFVGTYAAVNGSTTINQASLLFNSTLSGVNGCWVFYSSGAPNQLGLVGDNGVSVTYLTLDGSSTTIQNSQCILSALNSYAVLNNNDTLLMGADLTFKPAFAGPKTIYMTVNTGSLSSGWEIEGTWTVPAGSVAPLVIAVDPSSGEEANATFSAVYLDYNGASAITQAYLLFSPTLSAAHSCWVFYNGDPTQLGLVNDAGTVVNYVTLGTNTTVQNSQCILHGNGSFVGLAGSRLTVQAFLTFQPAFGGTKSIFMNANAGALNSGWQLVGNWSVPTNNVAPLINYVSPSSGSGATRTFTGSFLDINGATAITQAYILFNSTLSGANACWVFYNGDPTQLGLVNDAGTVVTYVTLGTSTTVQNSQCTLNGLGSTITFSGGDYLYVTANLTFKPAFTGAKTVYLEANAGSLFSGWQPMGTWTAP